MNAVISGRSATALLINGERLTSTHADAIKQSVPRQSADVPFLFGDCDDLQFLENVTFDQVKVQLKRACDNDDALQIILILLDSELSSEVREEAAEALEELLTDELPTIGFADVLTKALDEPLTNDYVSEYLQSVLYANPLPAGADFDGAIKCCEQGSAVLAQYFLEKLQKLQPIIRKVRLAWEAIPAETFGSAEIRARWHTEVVRSGTFHEMVMKIAGRESLNTINVASLLKSVAKTLPEFEVIQRLWIEPIRLEPPNPEELTEQSKSKTKKGQVINEKPYRRQVKVNIGAIKAENVSIAGGHIITSTVWQSPIYDNLSDFEFTANGIKAKREFKLAAGHLVIGEHRIESVIDTIVAEIKTFNINPDNQRLIITNLDSIKSQLALGQHKDKGIIRLLWDKTKAALNSLATTSDLIQLLQILNAYLANILQN